MVRILNKAESAAKIERDLEKNLYALFVKEGLAQSSLETCYPAMSVEQIAETLTTGFATEILAKLNIPSAQYNALSLRAFRTALIRAMNDCLAGQNINHEACPPRRGHEETRSINSVSSAPSVAKDKSE